MPGSIPSSPIPGEIKDLLILEKRRWEATFPAFPYQCESGANKASFYLKTKRYIGFYEAVPRTEGILGAKIRKNVSENRRL